MKDFSQLRKNLKKDFSSLRKVKAALLGDSSTQFLAQAIRGTGFDHGLNLDIWEADYDQIERQIQDSESELYKSESEVVIVFQSSEKLLARYNKSTENRKRTFAQDELQRIIDQIDALCHDSPRNVIYFNFPEIDDGVFGSFANQTAHSFLYQIRQLNIELMKLAESQPSLFLCDLSSIQNRLGRSVTSQPSLYVTSDMTLSLDVLPHIAQKCVRVIAAMSGRVRKCLILDLDNTLWGGVIGDDGIGSIQIGSLGIGKAFSELQHWAKKLKERGIILAVCSKNTDEIAREPFVDHPDMVLKLDDIAVFKANWNSKVDNIREIQETLNFGFDAMVFLDDNPYERNLIRTQLPEVFVPELPEDPAEYLEYLYGLDLFETTSVSGEDAQRTKMYQQETQRLEKKREFFDEAQYLESLDMVSVVEGFSEFNAPRIAQLSQRSNQFNLRTIRYTESEVLDMMSSAKKHGLTFTLEDKFGDNGLISVVILEEQNSSLFVDTWLMSCRVLKRGMEDFILNEICSFAHSRDLKTIRGEYLPTSKNMIVKDLYPGLGFLSEGDQWLLDVSTYENRKTYIARK